MKKQIRVLLTGFAAFSLLASMADAQAYGAKHVENARALFTSSQSFDVRARGRLEVAFSPDEGSEALVVKVIESAKKEVLVLAYSFTSEPVVDALRLAVKRGVSVRVVADEKSNLGEDKSGKGRSALSTLATAGADVRTIRVYPIHHDKVIVVDRQTVELGSFNYSAAAAHRNSENVLVNWGNPDLAAVYMTHFERNYRQAKQFLPKY